MALRSQLPTLFVAALTLPLLPLHAQKLQAGPPTDTSAQASPIQKTPKAPAIDAATESSPEIGPAIQRGLSIAPATAIHATLSHGIDSGSLKNGQNVHAKLSAPVRTSAGTTLPAGTPVVISVIGTAPAGKLTAAGEFSLEAIQVGPVETTTDIKTYRGQPGHREVADAAPALGTNAGLPAGAAILFHISRPAVPATGEPKNAAITPGSIDGTASGSKPAASAGANLPSYGTNLPSPLGSQPQQGSNAAQASQGSSTKPR